MKEDKMIIDSAITKGIYDSRQTKIASEVLNILADNNTTISEATKILKLADNMIANARLSRQRSLINVPQDVQA